MYKLVFTQIRTLHVFKFGQNPLTMPLSLGEGDILFLLGAEPVGAAVFAQA